MVLTSSDLLGLLTADVRVFLHLAGKITPAMHDYRPTPKQRSTSELVKYVSMMGPTLFEAVRAGAFDQAGWSAAEQAASRRTVDEALETIAGHPAAYASALAGMSDDDFRVEVDVFGTAPRGVHLVSWVLNGCVAYRMQLFLYLKACGREDLNTMNLWSGVDQAS